MILVAGRRWQVCRRLLPGLVACFPLWSAPALADTGSEWFDEQVSAVQRALGFDAPQSAARRARFMACGYVSPSLIAPEPPSPADDRAFAQMLERLRRQLRTLGDAP